MNKVSGYIKSHRALLYLTTIVICLFMLGIYYFVIRPYERTNNAYVGANYATIATQVPGPITKIHVTNNQFVKAGDLLFEIDARPFQIAVNKAQANLELTGKEVREVAASVDQAAATAQKAKANLANQQINTERVVKLADQGVLPAEDKDDATTKLEAAQDTYNEALAALAQARINLGKLGDQNEEVRYAIAELERAQLELSYTKISAPIDGQISNCVLYLGQYMEVGTEQFAIIADNEFWVDANYNETQLSHMQIGQAASIAVDMYPGKEFIGEIISISGASGTVFSLLPPQNATGNWVKVTQRVPVRIIVKNIDPKYPLRLGTSANVRVRILP